MKWGHWTWYHTQLLLLPGIVPPFFFPEVNTEPVGAKELVQIPETLLELTG